MRYVSTRGQAPVLDFEGALLVGLAADGGLYVPESWPQFSAADWRAMRGLPYAEIALRVIRPFVGGCIPDADLQRMINEAYATFGHRAVVPPPQTGHHDRVLELFHGPPPPFTDVRPELPGPLF